MLHIHPSHCLLHCCSRLSFRCLMQSGQLDGRGARRQGDGGYWAPCATLHVSREAVAIVKAFAASRGRTPVAALFMRAHVLAHVEVKAEAFSTPLEGALVWSFARVDERVTL